MLDAEHVGADSLTPLSESIAITDQMPVLQDNPMVAICPVDVHDERLFAGHLETLRLALVAVRFGDQAVQVGLQHLGVPTSVDIAFATLSLRSFEAIPRGVAAPAGITMAPSRQQVYPTG